MRSFIVNIIMVAVFWGAIVFVEKSKKERCNALIIFGVAVYIKVLFLLIWTFYKTGELNFTYLQFPDENYYINVWFPGEEFKNIYSFVVWLLRYMGFSILNIKVLNILVASFALVRLYSLKSYVHHKNRYITMIIVLGCIFYLRMVYCSVFVLKESLLYYLTIEFFIQAYLRPFKKNDVFLYFTVFLLTMVRKYLAFLFIIILFFNQLWKVEYKRVFLTLVIVLLTLAIFGGRIARKIDLLFFIGVAWSNPDYARADLRHYQNEDPSEYYTKYAISVFKKVFKVLPTFYQKDYVYILVVSSELFVLLYFLLIRKVYRKMLEFWPVVLFAMIYLFLGLLTHYNLRYNLFVISLIMNLFIAIDCKLIPWPHSVKVVKK